MDGPIRPCECGFYDIAREHSRVGGSWCDYYLARTQGWSSDACGPAALWYAPDGRRVGARQLRKALQEDGSDE